MRAVLLTLVLTACCGDDLHAPPPADSAVLDDAGFGGFCPGPDLAVCHTMTPQPLFGWCIGGVCRRSCNGSFVCPPGEMPSPTEGGPDCYCLPE